MPEIRFQIQWPDGTQETCYSPSLIVKDYFTVGQNYELTDFVDRSRTALQQASDRVMAKYGMPCGMALRQLHQIEMKAEQYDQLPAPIVKVIRFIE
ncbi:MAG: MSMEG_0570 family nitrogen starvation response protein [Elainellaceae cyanobacterium]